MLAALCALSGLSSCAARPPPPQSPPAFFEQPNAATRTSPRADAWRIVAVPETSASDPSALAKLGDGAPSPLRLGAALGTAEPLALAYAAPTGNWIVYCQARHDAVDDGLSRQSGGRRRVIEGDRAEIFLATPSFERSIDSFVGADKTGRYALFMRNRALLLWDSILDRQIDLSALGADARFDAASYAAHRALSFDASGTHLLYLRRGATATRLVERELRTGLERELDPGPGEVWRAEYDPGDQFIILQIVSADSNRNGRLDWPVPLAQAPLGCPSPTPRYRAFEGHGDRAQAVYFPRAGGAARADPEIVMAAGDGLVRRAATGALFFERAGKSTLLERAECSGRIVHTDPLRRVFVIGCVQKPKTGRIELDLVEPGKKLPLGIDLASTDLDQAANGSPRLVPFYPGTDSVLLDVERKDLAWLRPSDQVITTLGEHALVRRGSSLLIFDANTRTEQVLPGRISKFPDIFVTPPFALVSPLVVNVESGTLVGSIATRALALSNSGRVLCAERDQVSADTLARGPLAWREPIAAETLDSR